MPLFEVGPQLNSACNLKSSNFRSLNNSGPSPGVISSPFSTFHSLFPGPLVFHPAKSFPLNKATGLPHLGGDFLSRDGARSPDHSQVAPFAPFTFPDSVFPASKPSKTMSTGRPSSSLGETNVNLPFDNSTLGSGREFPHRPTKSAFNCPPSSRSSSHEGYSRPGARSVKSHRPRYALADSAACTELSICHFPADKYALAHANKIPITNMNTILLGFIVWTNLFPSNCNQCISTRDCTDFRLFRQLQRPTYASKNTVSRSPCK